MLVRHASSLERLRAGAAGAVFKEAGFEPAQKLLASSTKVLSFRKPAAAPSPPPVVRPQVTAEVLV